MDLITTSPSFPFQWSNGLYCSIYVWWCLCIPIEDFLLHLITLKKCIIDHQKKIQASSSDAVSRMKLTLLYSSMWLSCSYFISFIDAALFQLCIVCHGIKRWITTMMQILTEMITVMTSTKSLESTGWRICMCEPTKIGKCSGPCWIQSAMIRPSCQTMVHWSSSRS